MRSNNHGKTAFTSHSKLLLIVIYVVLVAFVAIAIWGGITLYNNIFSGTNNRAEEVALPFDRVLTSHGATKACSVGDNGHGSDNRMPWYEGYYQIQRSSEQTFTLIENMAKEKGYNLVQATPTNRRNDLPADEYLKEWYFDNSNKKSDYKDLQDGPILLSIGINAHGSDTACKDKLTIDTAHTVVTIHISLPNVKD